MAASTGSVQDHYGEWFRLITLLDYGGRSICKEKLKSEGVPIDGNGADLWEFFNDHKDKFNFKRQKLILCPADKKTDKAKFDISLYSDILDKVYSGKYGELVGGLRTWRNQLFRKGDKVYAQKEFDKSWNKLSAFLGKNGFDLDKVNDRKTCEFFSNPKYILHINMAYTSFLQGNMKRVYLVRTFQNCFCALFVKLGVFQVFLKNRSLKFFFFTKVDDKKILKTSLVSEVVGLM